jgi:hypothetical protein
MRCLVTGPVRVPVQLILRSAVLYQLYSLPVHDWDIRPVSRGEDPSAQIGCEFQSGHLYLKCGWFLGGQDDRAEADVAIRFCHFYTSELRKDLVFVWFVIVTCGYSYLV